VEIEITRDPWRFAERANGLLASRIECNRIATSLDRCLKLARRNVSTAGGPAGSRPVFALGSDPVTGDVVAAALRTPGWVMLADGFDGRDAARELLERWLAEDPTVGEFSAKTSTARALTHGWKELTGGTTVSVVAEALHSLSVVTEPPRPAAGRLRRATGEDRELLVEWMLGFDPANQDQRRAGRIAADVDERIAAGHYFVWEDGRPVSALAHHIEVARAVRIGPVYTPARFRNRGYASAAVAALSRRLLERGAERCCLFTDLSNPTSNKIYASVGYTRIGDWEQHRLLR
jgi:predicted GNAT family acetyltransferase